MATYTTTPQGHVVLVLSTVEARGLCALANRARHGLSLRQLAATPTTQESGDA